MQGSICVVNREVIVNIKGEEMERAGGYADD